MAAAERGWELAVRVGLALAFVAAGALKIADPAGFALSLARLGVAPRGLIGPVAIVLPWIEIATGAALLASLRWREAGIALAGALLVAFTAALAVALLRGVSASCGCFGVEGGVLSRPPAAIARNLVLIAATAASARAIFRSRSGPASPA